MEINWGNKDVQEGESVRVFGKITISIYTPGKWQQYQNLIFP